MIIAPYTPGQINSVGRKNMASYLRVIVVTTLQATETLAPYVAASRCQWTGRSSSGFHPVYRLAELNPSDKPTILHLWVGASGSCRVCVGQGAEFGLESDAGRPCLTFLSWRGLDHLDGKGAGSGLPFTFQAVGHGKGEGIGGVVGAMLDVGETASVDVRLGERTILGDGYPV